MKKQDKKNHPGTPITVYPFYIQEIREGLSLGWVGHMQMSEEEARLNWRFYRIGDELDFEPNKRFWPKFIETGDGMSGDINKELRTPEGLLFLLADGIFPIGCGARELNTVMAVKPGENFAEGIADQIYEDIGTQVKQRATGRLRLEESGLYVVDFSTNFFDRLEDYQDTIAGLVRSKIVPEGTPLKYQVTV